MTEHETKPQRKTFSNVEEIQQSYGWERPMMSYTPEEWGTKVGREGAAEILKMMDTSKTTNPAAK